MLQFTKLEKNVQIIQPFIKRSQVSFCDISLGVRFMWGDEFVVEYAIYNDTLIMKETSPDYENAFYYPMGSDVDGAIEKIEEYTRANNIPLKFCCLDNRTVALLSKKYHTVSIFNDRDWSDYIYDADKFKTYSGKRFSGQRNHVNKFKRLYPDYKFKAIEKDDFLRIKEFLNEFNSKAEFLRWSEVVEQKKVFDLVENMFSLDQVGGLLEVDGKVVAFSIGEIINDTLIVHIEKALTKYEGVYPTMAQEFAKAFAGSGVKFVNREEDCGDTGLRISKLQYQPLEVKEKNFLLVKTLFDKISAPVVIKTERLTITDITEEDKFAYAKLYLDKKLNEWWGYDYAEDLGKNAPSPDYFYNFQNSLKQKKEEYSFAIRLDGQMIGELVLHNFDYYGGAEIGFRLFSEYHGKGFAFESASALKEYAFNNLGVKTLKAKCFKQNANSKKLIEKLAFKKIKESDTHYFFELNSSTMLTR